VGGADDGAGGLQAPLCTVPASARNTASPSAVSDPAVAPSVAGTNELSPGPYTQSVVKPDAVCAAGASAAVLLVVCAKAKDCDASFWSTYVAVRPSPLCATASVAPATKPVEFRMPPLTACRPMAQRT
jgi:hypothetical protein